MQQRYPGELWMKKFNSAFIEAGGHNSDMALLSIAPFAAEQFRLGATAASAGAAAAAIYKLNEQVTGLEDVIQQLTEEVEGLTGEE